MRKVQLFSFLLISLFICSCRTKDNLSSQPKSRKTGNLTSINYKRGRIRQMGNFGKYNRPRPGQYMLLNYSRNKSGPSFNSYSSRKGRAPFTPSPMANFKSRSKRTLFTPQAMAQFKPGRGRNFYSPPAMAAFGRRRSGRNIFVPQAMAQFKPGRGRNFYSPPAMAVFGRRSGRNIFVPQAMAQFKSGRGRNFYSPPAMANFNKKSRKILFVPQAMSQFNTKRGGGFFTPAAMARYSYRDRNISRFKYESRSKTFSASFPNYKTHKASTGNPQPMKWADKSSKNIRNFKSDIKRKTRYGGGKPSVYGNRNPILRNGRLRKKTFTRNDNKFLFLFPAKKSMHTYNVKGDQTTKKRRGILFWKNIEKAEKRHSERVYKKTNRKKKKPEMELFDPKLNIIKKN